MNITEVKLIIMVGTNAGIKNIMENETEIKLSIEKIKEKEKNEQS